MNKTNLQIIQSKINDYAPKPWSFGRAAPYQAAQEDKFMPLSLQAVSDQPLLLSSYLVNPLLKASGRRNITRGFIAAIEAVVGDLLQAASISMDLFSFRPMGKGEFDGMRIGHGPAKAVLDGLTALGLVDHEPGFKCGINGNAPGQASRYRAKAALLELALRFGITPGNWSSHYQYVSAPAKVAHPILVRGKREYWHKADKGPKLTIDKSNPAYVAGAAQVQSINAYVARQTIGGCYHLGFRRIFNHGDQNGFDYNMGGRLYANGGGYQMMPSSERALITINGEATVEIDIRASHLTVIYALAGVPLDSALDPYVMPWPPRKVVKAWTTMILGYGKFQTKWSKQTKERLAEDGFDLDDYPIDDVRAAVLSRHPIFLDWVDGGIGWAGLQYRESQVILAVMEKLAIQHDVLALPVHDSIIIPASRADLAQMVLKEIFRQMIGSEPVLTCKKAGYFKPGNTSLPKLPF